MQARVYTIVLVDAGMHRTRRGKTRSITLALLLCACIFVCLFALGGCKYSDVLTEHIEDPANGILDETQDPIYKQNPDAPEESDLVSLVIDDSDRIDDQLRDLPQFDSQSSPQNETEQQEHTDDTSNDENASEGTESSEDAGQNSSTGESDSSADSDAGTDDMGEGDGTSEEVEEQPGTEAYDGVAEGGRGGTGEVYDSTGENAELPEEGTLAAVGQYATIVQMLAGGNALKATDASWKDMVQNKGLFQGEYDGDLTQLSTPWQANGSDGYTLDIDALIAADPDGVLVDNSDVMLAEDEKARLQEAQIDVITVPTLGSTDTTDESIISAVRTVGQILSNAQGGYNVSSQVTEYERQHDAAINAMLDANGGYSYKTVGDTRYAGKYQGTSDNGIEVTNYSSTQYTTVFVDEITTALNSTATANRTYAGDEIEYLNDETANASNGIGLSVRGKSNEFVLMDYYLQVSGVVNNSYDGAKPMLSDDDGKRTIILPGSEGDLIPPSLIGTYLSRNNYSALWYKPSSSQWRLVGDDDFPGVLARNDEIANRIYQSSIRPDGIYNVGKSYFVRVVPSGAAGSWVDGNVESFLLAPWAFDVFQRPVTPIAESYADSFYSVFYRKGGSVSVIDDFNTTYSSEPSE